MARTTLLPGFTHWVEQGALHSQFTKYQTKLQTGWVKNSTHSAPVLWFTKINSFLASHSTALTFPTHTNMYEPTLLPNLIYLPQSAKSYPNKCLVGIFPVPWGLYLACANKSPVIWSKGLQPKRLQVSAGKPTSWTLQHRYLFCCSYSTQYCNSLTFCRNTVLVASLFHFSLLPCSCSLVNASAYWP